MIYLMSDIAEFKQSKAKNNNLKRNLMIGAGLLGGVALTTIGVRSYLRNGKLVRQSTRKVNKVNEIVDPMKLTTPKEIIDNHQSVVRLVLPHRTAINFKDGQILNYEDLNNLIDDTSYWKLDVKNTPTPNDLNLNNETRLNPDSLSERYIEIAYTGKPHNGKTRYSLRNNMTDKDKGVILVNKNMKDLSGLINFNRV